MLGKCHMHMRYLPNKAGTMLQQELHCDVGCSKTTLARAAATASKASLFPLSGAQLHSMYVGEGEALLRGTFKLARQAAPSIIFLDEIDSLAGMQPAALTTAIFAQSKYRKHRQKHHTPSDEVSSIT